MFWTILLIIAATIVVILALIVFSPFGLNLHFSNITSRNDLDFHVFLIHESFCKVTYDFTTNEITVRIIGLSVKFNKKEDSLSSDGDDRMKDVAGKVTKKGPVDKKADIEKPNEVQDTSESQATKKVDPIIEGDQVAPDYVSRTASTAVDRDTGADDHPVNDQVSIVPTESDDKPQAKREPVVVETPVPGNGNGKDDTKENDANDNVNGDDASKGHSATKHKKPTIRERINDLFDKINRNPIVFFTKDERLRRRVLRWIWRIIKSIFKIVRIRRCLIKAEILFDDPSVGGKIYGYYEGLRHAIGQYSKRFNLYFRPLFISGDNAVTIRFRMYTSIWKLLYPLTVAVFTLPYITFGLVWWRYYLMNRRIKKDEKRT